MNKIEAKKNSDGLTRSENKVEKKSTTFANTIFTDNTLRERRNKYMKILVNRILARAKGYKEHPQIAIPKALQEFFAHPTSKDNKAHKAYNILADTFSDPSVPVSVRHESI